MTIGDLTILVERKDVVQYFVISEEIDSDGSFCFRASGPTSRSSEKIQNFLFELNRFLLQLDQQIFHMMRSIDKNMFIYESASRIRRVPQFVPLDALQMFVESSANCSLDFIEDYQFIPAQFKRKNKIFSTKTYNFPKTYDRFHKIAKMFSVSKNS